MMHPTLRIPLILGVVAAAVALVAAAAFGGTVRRFDSTVRLAKANPFHGRVISPKHACEIRRHIKVFDKKPGPDGLFGTTISKRRGRWSLPAMPNGNFYAKVTRNRVTTQHKTFVCRPDTSPIRHFGT